MKNLLSRVGKLPRSAGKFGGVFSRGTRKSVSYTSRSINRLKRLFVRKMFWGRGSLYKNSFHILVVALTVSLLVSGVFTTRYRATGESSLDVGYGAYGNNDLLQQGSSIASVVAIEKAQNYQVRTYKIKDGDSLDEVAKKYEVSKDTIKWANPDLLSPYHDNVNVGTTLKIPEINGVLEKVDDDDTLASILDKTGGNRFDVIELNELVGPKYSLSGKEYIFVPGGELPEPPPLIQYRSLPNNGGYISPGFTGAALGNLPAGFFDDPLSHPSCSGYRYFRGFRPGGFPYGHTGIDIGKAGGCYIRAAGNGVVTQAGIIDVNTGYAVVIDHGDTAQTHYYHGDGNIYVRVGETVSRGQIIMYMGCSGNCNGTHLHLTLRHNGGLVDPAAYVPYRR